VETMYLLQPVACGATLQQSSRATHVSLPPLSPVKSQKSMLQIKAQAAHGTQRAKL
jgi:hypothetical protein